MSTKAGRLKVVLVAIALLGWPSLVLAEYTLVLKNGRRITVQSYREQGGMIKFYGFGGEIAIAKDQIQSIVKGAAGRTLSVGDVPTLPAKAPPAEVGAGTDADTGTKLAQPEAVPAGGAAPPAPELKPEEKKGKEEKEYQERVKQITDQLRSARENYAVATRGSGGPEPTLLTSEEAIRARTEDLKSRLRDRQHSPTDPGAAKLATPSPFAGVPPSETQLRPREVAPTVDVPLTGYTQREKELSDLRARIRELETARENLIGEMKRKNLDTGTLFLDQ